MGLRTLGTVTDGDGYFLRYRCWYRAYMAVTTGTSFVMGTVAEWIIVMILRRYFTGNPHHVWGEDEGLCQIALLALYYLDRRPIEATLRFAGWEIEPARQAQSDARELLRAIPYGD